MLVDGVQRSLGEYVCAWRWRALAAMSSPNLISVCSHSFVNQEVNEFIFPIQKKSSISHG